jgi:hypothetical protein
LAAEFFSTFENKHPKFMTPKCGNCSRQQESINAFGMLQAGMFQIETARFVISETLLNAHPPGVFTQTSTTGDLVGHDSCHFRLSILVCCPSHRDIGLPIGFFGPVVSPKAGVEP